MNALYYTSTSELPMWNWHEINSTHDWRYLFKDAKHLATDKKKAFKLLDQAPEDIWNEIYTDYIDKHGLNDDLKHWFELMNKAAQMRIDCHLYGQKHLRTIYRAVEQEATVILEDIQGGSISETTALISKNMAFRIDLKVTPVDEYMAYIKISSDGKNKRK